MVNRILHLPQARKLASTTTGSATYYAARVIARWQASSSKDVTMGSNTSRLTEL